MEALRNAVPIGSLPEGTPVRIAQGVGTIKRPTSTGQVVVHLSKGNRWITVCTFRAAEEIVF